MIANTVRSDKTGPTLRGHSITLEKVLVKSPVEKRHTKVSEEDATGFAASPVLAPVNQLTCGVLGRVLVIIY